MLRYFDSLGVDLFLHVLNTEGAQGKFFIVRLFNESKITSTVM